MKSEEFRVEHSVEINSSPARAWDVISEPAIGLKAHPFCMECEVLAWTEGDHRDVFRYYNGVTAFREATQWLTGQGYDLHVGPSDVEPVSVVKWRIESTQGGDACRLTITSDPIGAGLDRTVEEQRARVALMSDYLPKTMSGYRFHIETGQTVLRNQFGAHPFSPEVPAGPNDVG